MKVRLLAQISYLSLIFGFIDYRICLADEMKRNVFLLGIQLGGAECTASLNEAFSNAERPGAFNLIKRNVSWSIDTARRMGNPANSLVELQSQLDQLSFSQIQERLIKSIESEQNSWESLSTQISSLFILGVHLEGAECVASGVQSFSRKEKPGSLELIKRNVIWVKQDVKDVKLNLAVNQIDELLVAIDHDASFLDILKRLEKIRLAWQKQLESQPAF